MELSPATQLTTRWGLYFEPPCVGPPQETWISFGIAGMDWKTRVQGFSPFVVPNWPMLGLGWWRWKVGGEATTGISGIYARILAGQAVCLRSKSLVVLMFVRSVEMSAFVQKSLASISGVVVSDSPRIDGSSTWICGWVGESGRPISLFSSESTLKSGLNEISSNLLATRAGLGAEIIAWRRVFANMIMIIPVIILMLENKQTRRFCLGETIFFKVSRHWWNGVLQSVYINWIHASKQATRVNFLGRWTSKLLTPGQSVCRICGETYTRFTGLETFQRFQRRETDSDQSKIGRSYQWAYCRDALVEAGTFQPLFKLVFTNQSLWLYLILLFAFSKVIIRVWVRSEYPRCDCPTCFFIFF